MYIKKSLPRILDATLKFVFDFSEKSAREIIDVIVGITREKDTVRYQRSLRAAAAASHAIKYLRNHRKQVTKQLRRNLQTFASRASRRRASAAATVVHTVAREDKSTTKYSRCIAGLMTFVPPRFKSIVPKYTQPVRR